MNTKSDAQTLIETSSNLSHAFLARFDRHGRDQQIKTANAIVECATVLARRLGHLADDYIFGHGVFSLDEARRLVVVMRRLQTHAEEKDYEGGITAALGLRGVAYLIYAQQFDDLPATNNLVDQELAIIGGVMQRIITLAQPSPLART
jgi:hypothetical protein